MTTRRNQYEYQRKLKDRYKDQVWRLLGSACSKCQAPNPSRLDFVNYEDPDRKISQTNKITLYRKMLDGEINSQRLQLLCSDCWILDRKEYTDGLQSRSTDSPAEV